ncbi:MAG: right-handed parallel beta-helix repeat-containing protein [Candidatus Bathyarchaeia archaeon]
MVIAVLLLSSFIALYRPSVVPNAVAGSPFSSPQFLDAKLLPSSTSLHVGDSQVFTLTLDNGSRPVSVQWSVNGSVVQSDYFTKSNSSFPIQSNYTYTCLDATLDTVNIQVQIIDALGRTTSESAVVYDPASYPANYLGASTATANYIIHADGTGWYYAVNGTDGSIVSSWTSTNFNTVFNDAQGVLTSGGEIAIASGSYTVTAKITISNPSIELVGQGNATCLSLANGVNNSVLAVTGAGCVIESLQINGNSAGQSSGYCQGILVYGAQNTLLENLYVHDTFTDAVEISAGAVGTQVIGLTVNRAGNYGGIIVYGSGTVSTTHDILIDSCTVTNSGVNGGADGIFLSGTCNDTVTNCVIDGATDTCFEIQSGGVTNSPAYGITVSNIVCANGYNDIDVDGMYPNPINYPLSGLTLTNFVVTNATDYGMYLSSNVTQSEIGDGFISNTGLDGIFVQNNVTDCTFHDITLNNTALDSGNGAFEIGYDSNNNIMRDLTSINCQGIGGSFIDTLTNSVSSHPNIKGPNQFIDCNSYNAVNNGFYDYEAYAPIVQGGVYSNSGNVGINIYTADNAQITGTTISNSVSEQISLTISNNDTVVSNTILNTASTKHAIFLSTSNCDLISTNYVTNNVGGAVGLGIEEYNGVSNIIQNNDFKNLATGIYLDNQDDLCTILSGNNFQNVTTPINDGGTFTITNAKTQIVTVNGAVTGGQLLYEGTNGQYYVARADSAADMGGINVCVTAMAAQTVGAGGQCLIMTQGYFTNPSWSLTIGSAIYASAATAGAVTQTAPSATNNVIENCGSAYSATEVWFNPQVGSVIVHS